MDCAAFCMMAVAVLVTQQPQDLHCSYCIHLRGLTETCNYDLRDCSQNNPGALLYCLTVNIAQDDDFVRRSMRCISQPQLNATDEFFEAALQQKSCEDFGAAQLCNCSTCPIRKRKPTTTIAPASIFYKFKTTQVLPRRMTPGKTDQSKISNNQTDPHHNIDNLASIKPLQSSNSIHEYAGVGAMAITIIVYFLFS
uniref:Protein quiver n=1 Tax=Panagrellus redivivus TaxID=6233 RepID=A0A7E4W3X3_PANRE